MRILFLDDDLARRDEFREWFRAAKETRPQEEREKWHLAAPMSATSARIEFMVLPQFDLAFLDHDLRNRVMVSVPDQCDGDGCEVAVYIAEGLFHGKKPKKVICHSWNPDGRREMLGILLEAGVPTVECPFGERLKEFLE